MVIIKTYSKILYNMERDVYWNGLYKPWNLKAANDILA